MASIDANTLTTTEITSFTTGSTNIPLGKNPQAELIVLVEEGVIDVKVMGTTGVVQTITGLERYGNLRLSEYRRFIFPDENPDTGLNIWSEWLKIS